MENSKELKERGIVIKYGADQSKYKDVVLFPEKLKKANEHLKHIELPKI